ncbi:MAG: hypothetical protein ACP5U2_05615, partial [Bryobacteraceae bacterium]
EAEHQIVSGVYQLEENRFRWMAQRAVILLKSPARPAPVEVKLYVPGNAAARRVRIEVDGRTVLDRVLPGPGFHSIVSEPVTATAPVARLVISLDRTFRVPGDHRDLGVILSQAGFLP